MGCTGFAHETAARFGDERVLLGAIARTNVADPREIVTNVVPAATRGRGPFASARMTGYMVTRGQAFASRCREPTDHRGDRPTWTLSSPK